MHAKWALSSTPELSRRIDIPDVLSVYAITGQLVTKINLSGGTVHIPLNRGIYLVTLPDAKRIQKVVIR